MGKDNKLAILHKYKIPLAAAAVLAVLATGYGAGAVKADNSASSNTQSQVIAHPTSSQPAINTAAVDTNTKDLSGNAAKQASEIQRDPNYKYSSNLTGNAQIAQNAVLKDGIQSVKQQQKAGAKKVEQTMSNQSQAAKDAVTRNLDQVQNMRSALRNDLLDDSSISDDQTRVLVSAYQHKQAADTSLTMNQWVINTGADGLNNILQAALPVAPAQK